MSNDAFKASFARAIAATGEKAQLLCRKWAIEIANELIERSPVNTGRFRANWMSGYGAVNYTTTADTDKDGTETSGRIASGLMQWDGATLYVTNSLPYAQRLEDGWSKQAPGGMVGLTAQRWNKYLESL